MIKSKLALVLVVVCSVTAKAQTEPEEYKDIGVFPRYFGWDIRVGAEKNTFNTVTTNTITNEVTSTYTGTYKNRRLVVDCITVESALQFGKNIKVGIPFGISVGFAPQSKKYTNQYTGPNPYSSWPSGFRGNQGMEIGENLALNFEMKLGIGLGYKINPEKNIGVAVTYNYRFWSKANLGFYALPKFFGGFVDVNFTYKRWQLLTTFRANRNDLSLPSGANLKTGYFSIMPVYNIPKRNKKDKYRQGLNILGLRIETTHAKSEGTGNSDFYTSYYTKLKANTFMMGVYFGFFL